MTALGVTDASRQQTDSPIARGNAAMRNGLYPEAIRSYCTAFLSTPGLAKSIAQNIARARQKYRSERKYSAQLHVGVCGCQLTNNAAGRAYTLAMLYSRFAKVELIGALNARIGRELWEPIRHTSISKHTIVVDDWCCFIDQAIKLVMDHPYDVVHLSKPRAPNILFGLLYKLIWGAKVLMDVDDEELAFVGGGDAISVESYLSQYGHLPRLQDLATQDWTRIAVDLVNQFDGVTVSNPALQARYGGEIIRHARDESHYWPSAELTQRSRAKFGVPAGKKVVLFFGTPRVHKGLLETAQAIAELQRSDVLFAIIGDFPDPTLKQRLQSISGVDYLFIGNQPFDAVPEVVSIADFCILLQDNKSLASQFQSPAKLGDALAMEVPVIATETPALADAISAKALMPSTPDQLPRILNNLLDSPIAIQQLKQAGRRYFEASISFAPNTQALQSILSGTGNNPIGHHLLAFVQALSEPRLLAMIGPLTNTPRQMREACHQI